MFLLIFDQGDWIYDSAAFIDNLIVDSRANGASRSADPRPDRPRHDREKPQDQGGPVGAAVGDASKKKKKKKKAKVTIPFSSGGWLSFYCRVGPVDGRSPTRSASRHSRWKLKEGHLSV